MDVYAIYSKIRFDPFLHSLLLLLLFFFTSIVLHEHIFIIIICTYQQQAAHTDAPLRSIDGGNNGNAQGLSRGTTLGRNHYIILMHTIILQYYNIIYIIPQNKHYCNNI